MTIDGDKLIQQRVRILPTSINRILKRDGVEFVVSRFANNMALGQDDDGEFHAASLNSIEVVTDGD